MADDTESKLDLLWEVTEIAKLIGRSERQTFYLLSSGQIPAKKVGGRWVAERNVLMNFFLGTEKQVITGK